MNRLLYFVLLFLFPLGLIAQERIVPLHGNRKIMLAAKQLKKTHRTTSVSLDTIPFLDDFSKPGPYPDSSKWIDKKVYVNYGNPVCPHTLGVATFDGLDSIGKPYNPAASPYSSSPGDVLTSKPITWTSISAGTIVPKDSVYLSFYYQAGSYFGTDSNGGVHRSTLGYWPKTNDTLLLQFRAGGDTIWNTVWYHLGYQPVQDTDTTFHMVMIPFDTGTYTHSLTTLLSYFNNGFQFRFLAYSCGSGNVDHWSIDEVYLNSRKFTGEYADTMQNDIAFVYEAPPILSQYSAEPWEQFQLSDLRVPTDSMSLFSRNNNPSYLITSGNKINATYNYTITQDGNFINSYSGGADNIYPYVDLGYNTNGLQTRPSLNTTGFPSSLTGPTEFTITHYFDFRSNDFDQSNDTVRFNQVFNNYYAYDDGSAEASYFINPITGVPPFFAYQFTLNKPDSVFGLAIYFDYLFVDNASYSFILALWDDNGGQPGKMIYQDTINVNISNPIYQFDGNDEFTNYYFQKEQSLPAGKFYIGWVQTLGDSMNIGYDWNSNHEDRVFYSLDESNWQESSYPGTPMMRPFVGGYSQYVGINNIETPTADVDIYPNPAQNELNISGDNLRNAMVRIMGEDGRVIYEDDHFSGNTINTSSFPAGFYIVQVTPEHKQPVFKKLLITR